MASQSKEDKILRLFFENSPMKQWHFDGIVRASGVSRAVVNKWLKKYQNEGLVKRVKEQGRFPFFTCGRNNAVYQAKKRIYALSQLYQSGLVSHLLGLRDAKTVIIFGSMARGDWYKDSDIDIFIYGNPEGMHKNVYELKLRRDIELHVFETKEEIHEMKSGLIKNVIDGYVIKGRIEDFAKVS
jgi:predicted nucleotidyltransferase